MTEQIVIRMPKADWEQMVSDYENYCGLPESDIEVLQDVEILETL